MDTLRLTLKKEWFDMIASGDKKEEYREIKDFWLPRLFDRDGDNFHPKPFKRVHFRNGYNANSPVVEVEFKGIVLGYGRQKWGAQKGEKYIVIKLGKVLKKPEQTKTKP